MTSLYDVQCAREFEQLKPRVSRFFTEIGVACPYALPHKAVFYQALFSPLSERLMELFLASGYRRNGNCLYTMHCPDCISCIPIRLHVQEMQANRNQRRVWKKNEDVSIEFAPIEASEENVALCESFLKARFPKEKNSGRSYYEGFFLNRIISGMEVRYRVGERLIGNCIVDVGENWMNAVYFFFDPQEEKRSPGVLNILSLINICQDMGIGYLYLGYYLKEISAMSYKDRFSPHYLFINNMWQKKERKGK